MLAPFAEGHFRFRQENSFDGSFAGPAIAGELAQRSLIGGVGDQGLHDAQGASVGRMRELQRYGTGGVQLIDEDLDNAALRCGFLVQFFEGTGVQDEFLQEWRDVYDGAFRGARADEIGKEVESSHGDLAGHGYGVRRERGNPDGAERRNDPRALRGAQGHHTLRGEDELVLGMEMLGDDVAVGKIIRDAGDLGVQTALGVAQDAMALVRHLLSQ